MSASEVIKEVRKRLGISRMKLAKRLKLDSQAIIWMYEKKQRFPSHSTWMLLADLAREAGMDITVEMMRD